MLAFFLSCQYCFEDSLRFPLSAEQLASTWSIDVSCPRGCPEWAAFFVVGKLFKCKNEWLFPKMKGFFFLLPRCRAYRLENFLNVQNDLSAFILKDRLTHTINYLMPLKSRWRHMFDLISHTINKIRSRPEWHLSPAQQVNVLTFRHIDCQDCC